MGSWSRLGRSEAIIPRVAERVLRVIEIEAGGNADGWVFEERFASKVLRMMVMMMMIRTRHLEG